MSFHPSKCQVMHITNKRSRIETQYKIHRDTLETVDSIKYLGVNLQENLSWNNHVNQVAKKQITSARSFSGISRNVRKKPRNWHIGQWFNQSEIRKPSVGSLHAVQYKSTRKSTEKSGPVLFTSISIAQVVFSFMLQSLNWPLLQ